MDKKPLGSNDALFTDTYLFTCLMCCCAVLCACAGFRRGRWGVRGSEREGSYLVWCVAEGIYHHTYKTNINIYLMNTCEPFTYKRHFISVIQILDWTALHKYCVISKDQLTNIISNAKQLYHFHLFKIIVSKMIYKNFL